MSDLVFFIKNINIIIDDNTTVYRQMFQHMFRLHCALRTCGFRLQGKNIKACSNLGDVKIKK